MPLKKSLLQIFVFHTVSLKVLGSNLLLHKIQRQYLFLIFRVLSYTEKLWYKFASKFYFQKLPRDVNWKRPHLKLTTGEPKPLGAIK